MEVSLGDSHLYVVSNSMFIPIECSELFVSTPSHFACQLYIPSTVRCQVLGGKLLVGTICGWGIEICLCSPLYIFGELSKEEAIEIDVTFAHYNVQVSLKNISPLIYRSTVLHTCMVIILMMHPLTHLRIHVRRLKVIYYILLYPLSHSLLISIVHLSQGCHFSLLARAGTTGTTR